MDQNQKEIYQVEGKMFSISNKLNLLNMDGSQVLNSKKRLLSILPKYELFSNHGDLVAEIQRKFSFKPNFEVTIGDKLLKVQGSLFAHSFGIFDDDREIASIEKKVISWGDTYEIEINEEMNIELYLFIVIIIDQVIHERKRGR